MDEETAGRARRADEGDDEAGALPGPPAGGARGGGAAPGAPRWVKVSGIAALAVFVVFLAVHFFGGGMGPGMHGSGH